MTDRDLSKLLNGEPRVTSLLSHSRLLSLTSPPRVARFACAELFVRAWLERTPLSESGVEGFVRAACLDASPLIDLYERQLWPVREKWRERRRLANDPACAAKIEGVWSEVWNFLWLRLWEFCRCDGIFPAVDAGEALAIPFWIDRATHTAGFVDRETVDVPGWGEKALQVWRSIGLSQKVQLGCWFGEKDSAVARIATDGGSFGLALLLAMSRKENDFDPLAVLCTGAILSRELRPVDEIAAKNDLAVRIGAKVFACVPNGEKTPSKKDGILILNDGLALRTALSSIWDFLQQSGLELELNPDQRANRVEQCVGAFLHSDENAPHLARARQLGADCYGREGQLNTFGAEVSAQLRASEPRWLWITGEHGCGKSTFAAALALKFARSSCRISTHFFRDAPTLDLALRETADFLQRQEANLDLSLIPKTASGAKRFAAALVALAEKSLKGAAGPPAPPYLLVFDALDEADGALADLALLPACPGVALLFTSTPPEVGVLAELFNSRQVITISHLSRDGREVGLGRLTWENVEKWIDCVEPNLPEPWKRAIRAVEGLPSNIQGLLAEYGKDRSAHPPDGVQATTSAGYYEQRLEHLFRRCNAEDVELGALMLRVLTLLAGARGGCTLDESAFQYLLKDDLDGMINPDLAKAIAMAAPLLTIKHGLGWQLHNPSLREVLRRSTSYAKWMERAAQRWRAAEVAVNDPTAPYSLRSYLARNLVPTLIERDDTAALVALSVDPRKTFLRLERKVRADDPRAGADTLHMAIRQVLKGSQPNFAAAAKLALVRADWLQEAARGDPMQELRDGQARQALTLVRMAEDECDRTLGVFAIAAWLACSGRKQEAARVLDEKLELWTKFPPSHGLCAATLLALLVDVPTQLDWAGLPAMLDGKQRLQMAPILAARGHFVEAMQVIHTASRVAEVTQADIDLEVREVIREFAKRDPYQALRWLKKITNPVEQAWTAVELTRIFSQMDRHAEAQKAAESVLAVPEMFRQQIYCLIARAEAWSRNRRQDKARALLFESEQAVVDRGMFERRSLRTPPMGSGKSWKANMERVIASGAARSWVICAAGWEVCNETERAQNCLSIAFHNRGRTQELNADRPYAELKDLSGFCCELAARDIPSFRGQLNSMLALLEQAVEKASKRTTSLTAKEQDDVFQAFEKVAMALARSGQFEPADRLARLLEGLQTAGLLSEDTSENARLTTLRGRIKAEGIRAGGTVSTTISRHSEPALRGFAAGPIARTLVRVGDPRSAVKHVLAAIPLRVANKNVGRWGPARVLMEIGALRLSRKDREGAESAWRIAEGLLKGLGSSHQGDYFMDRADTLYACGESEAALQAVRKGKEADGRIQKLKTSRVRAGLLCREALWSGQTQVDLLHLLPLLRHPTPETMAEAAAEAVKPAAAFGWNDEVHKLIRAANANAAKIKNEKQHWELRSTLAGELAEAAILKPEMDVHARSCLDALEKEMKHLTGGLPAAARGARSVLFALSSDWDQAEVEAAGIRDGNIRSRIFRHLGCIAARHPKTQDFAVRFARAITHRTSSRLPAVVEALAKEQACQYVLDLLPDCSEFPDAAYRAVGAMVAACKPDSAQLEEIESLCRSAVL